MRAAEMRILFLKLPLLGAFDAICFPSELPRLHKMRYAWKLIQYAFVTFM